MGEGTRGTVLIGVSGGVAAYKAVNVASALRQAEFDVHVAMTPAAARLVAPITFAAVTNQPVLTEIFVSPDTPDWKSYYPHLYPATETDCCLLVPATADLIARVAAGFGDDVVAASVLALPPTCHRAYCPAMNANMWQQPVVQENCARLDARGWQRIGPATGRLACGTSGPGRMSEPEDIVRTLRSCLERTTRLAGRRLLILSGPTVEAIDPVRYISNHSSGLMGQALALAASQAGAAVDFVSGPVAESNLPSGQDIAVHRVRSAAEMLATAEELFGGADAAVFVAAVADYTPAEPASAKQPKQGEAVQLKLQPTPDIAATLAAARRPGQVCLGFALETDNGPAKARRKLAGKHLDGIVLNDPTSFGSNTGRFQYIPAAGREEDWGQLPKETCARRVIDRVAAFFEDEKTTVMDA